MAAFRNRQANLIPVKNARIAFREIEQGIVSWVEFPATRERAFHRPGYPVPELHTLLFQIHREMISPLRQVVNKKCPARLNDANTFTDPGLAPLQILTAAESVFIAAVAVVFCKI